MSHLQSSGLELVYELNGGHVVTVHKSTFILLLTITAIALAIQGCNHERQNASDHSGASRGEMRLVQEASVGTRLHRPYSKIKVPAELLVDLVQPERASDPLVILVSASTSVLAKSAMITLRLPEIEGEPSRKELLWASETSELITEMQEYILPPLALGRYHFVAIIEFTPDRPEAAKLVLSESLYVDVRADRILSSNVSFRQIERLELYGKLEERAMGRPDTKRTDKRLTVPNYMSTEDADTALVESKMARLKATDPDIAHQIMALSSQRGESRADSEKGIRSRTGPPAFERAVPIPKEFRQ